MVNTAEVYVKYKIHTEVPAYHIIHNRYKGLKVISIVITVEIKFIIFFF